MITERRGFLGTCLAGFYSLLSWRHVSPPVSNAGPPDSGLCTGGVFSGYRATVSLRVETQLQYDPASDTVSRIALPCHADLLLLDFTMAYSQGITKQADGSLSARTMTGNLRARRFGGIEEAYYALRNQPLWFYLTTDHGVYRLRGQLLTDCEQPTSRGSIAGIANRGYDIATGKNAHFDLTEFEIVDEIPAITTNLPGLKSIGTDFVELALQL